MKAIRKLLAMALVVVMVLSMSAFVFAEENELHPRGCVTHSFVPRHVYRFFYLDAEWCGYYLDTYEECTVCGYTLVFPGDIPHKMHHFTEEGSDFCWQCYSHNCN